MMAQVEHKARALGTHWWNPPYLVPLVEVIRTADDLGRRGRDDDGAARPRSARRRSRSRRTSPALSATGCSTRCGARRSRWSRTASATRRRSTTSSRSSFGRTAGRARPARKRRPRRARSDPIDPPLCPAASRSRDRALALLDRMIGEGQLGCKSNEGFYAWTPERQAALRRRLTDHLKAQAGAQLRVSRERRRLSPPTREEKRDAVRRRQ